MNKILKLFGKGLIQLGVWILNIFFKIYYEIKKLTLSLKNKWHYIVIFIIVFILAIPAIEAVTNKELPYVKSVGNCRVLNTKLAYKLKDSKLVFYTSTGKREVIARTTTYLAKKDNSAVHVVVFDNKGVHHDLSKSFNDLNKTKKKSISDMNYASYKKNFIQNNDLIVLKFKNSNIEFSEFYIKTESFVYLYYTYVFFKTSKLMKWLFDENTSII